MERHRAEWKVTFHHRWSTDRVLEVDFVNSQCGWSHGTLAQHLISTYALGAMLETVYRVAETENLP